MCLTLFGRDTRGTVAVASAIAMIPLVVATGSAIDYQRLRVNKLGLQTALDAALLAAAAAPASQREVRAQAVYADNARRITRTGEVVRFWTEASTNTYRGTVEANLPTTVMSIAHINNVAVSAQSAVSLDDAAVCMLLTAPTGVALTMSLSSLIKMPGCKIGIRSTSWPAV